MNGKSKIIIVSPTELKEVVENAVKDQLDKIKKDNNNPFSDYLTISELSKLLNINRATIYTWTRKGILQSYGIGRRVYFKRIEIDNALIKLVK